MSATPAPDAHAAEPAHPPCPHCHCPVTRVVQHRVLPRGRAWLELKPCGHETTRLEYRTP